VKLILIGLLSCAAYAQTVAYDHADPQQVMDIVRPKDSGKHPAILAIHGGGFRAGSRKSYQATCAVLAEHGYVCATADYRLAPAAPFPAAVYDVKAAVPICGRTRRSWGSIRIRSA